MDFVILSRHVSQGKSRRDLVGIFQRHSIHGDGSVNVIDADDFTLIYKNSRFAKDTVNNTRIPIFDGYLFGDILHHPDYTPINYANTKKYMKSIETLNGGFCLGFANFSKNCFSICTDILGQYTVFYAHKDARHWAVSNSPEALAEIIDRKASPSIDNFVMNCTYLSAFAEVSPLKEIQVAEAGQAFSFRPEAGFQKTTSDENGHRIRKRGKHYKKALQEAAADIIRNCTLIADFTQRTGVYTIADLSGGVDTRMVLAGFIAAGRQNEIRFYNANNGVTSASPDRVVAARILDSFGLRPGAGISESSGSTAVLNARYSPGMAKFAIGSSHYFGMLPYAFEDFGNLYLRGFARVGGYCGGHTRAPGPNISTILRDHPTPEKIADLYVRQCTDPNRNNASAYMHAEAEMVLRPALEDYFSNLMLRVEPRLVPTFAYAENRSRRHFGLRTQNANKSRVSISPLATPRTLALHFHLHTFGDSFDNRIAHDLIQTMAGDKLCYFPFAQDFWRQRVVTWTGYDGPGTAVTDSRSLEDDHAFPASVILDEQRTLWSWFRDRSVRSENKYYGLSRNESFDVLMQSIPQNDDIWRFLDREKIIALKDQEKSNDAMKEMNIFRVMSAMLFYSGETRRSKLKDVVDVPSLMRERGIG